MLSKLKLQFNGKCCNAKEIMYLFHSNDDDDGNPETKIVREKLRRQQNNARER